jgi:2-polyprenyl-3-methyl-5-hydroxy-6-metoxy-1,4-benzoquinol methylase
MTATLAERYQHEIEHGRMLATQDPERFWGWKTPAGQCRARRRARLIMAGGRLGPGKRVLEIGCGTGMFTATFAESGARILAVDISPDLIARARRRGLPAERVTFLNRPFEECAINGPFDAIIGSSVLHHLDVPSALRKIHDLLEPGGVISFAEPNYLNPQVFLERVFQHWACFSYVSPDESAFVRWPLARQLRELDFENIRVTPRDWLHPRTSLLMMPFVRGLGWLLEHCPGCRELSGSIYLTAQKPATRG